MRLSKEEYATLQKRLPQRASKYGNRKKEIGGRTFDSTKEAKRYQELLLLQEAGEITDLKCQQTIACVVNLQHVCDYVADFTYYCRARKEVIHEDVKGMKTPMYRLKKKLVKATAGIEIVET